MEHWESQVNGTPPVENGGSRANEEPRLVKAELTLNRIHAEVLMGKCQGSS